MTSPALFYCFVDFAAGIAGPPFTYVVPAKIVAKALAENHQAWLAKPGKQGQPHKDGDMRRFLPDYSHLGLAGYGKGWLSPYREAWPLLLQEAHGEVVP